jgi:hypothetical protein
VNYLLPVNNTSQEDVEFNKEEVENIITQQIIISQLAKGISFEDTNNMDAYERSFVVKKLIQMENEKNEAKLKAMEQSKQQVSKKK